MSETVMDSSGETHFGAFLRRELAQGDKALAGVPPVLAHMLASTAPSLVSDDILAHIRGMLSDLSRQLVRAETSALHSDRDPGEVQDRVERLAAHFASGSALLSFSYALAVEGQLAEEIQSRSGIDQVLTPLMQELIASDDEAVAELAMATMAAQARFVQAHRRMSLPLAELPAELFHEILRSWSHFANDVSPASKTQVEALLRATFDESGSRAGMLNRLISSMNSGARAGLVIGHAGLALFATALARLSQQPREMAVLSCHSSQLARLALGLLASGLDPDEIAQTFMQLHPDYSPPQGIKSIKQEQAIEFLASTVPGASS